MEGPAFGHANQGSRLPSGPGQDVVHVALQAAGAARASCWASLSIPMGGCGGVACLASCQRMIPTSPSRRGRTRPRVGLTRSGLGPRIRSALRSEERSQDRATFLEAALLPSSRSAQSRAPERTGPAPSHPLHRRSEAIPSPVRATTRHTVNPSSAASAEEAGLAALDDVASTHSGDAVLDDSPRSIREDIAFSVRCSIVGCSQNRRVPEPRRVGDRRPSPHRDASSPSPDVAGRKRAQQR